MIAYQRRQQNVFATVHTEGSILPIDLLQRIADPQNAHLAGLTSTTYHLTTEKLNEAINHAWNRALSAWQHFSVARAGLPEQESGTTLTRERWLLPLFNELGYGRLVAAKPVVVGERSYAVSHCWLHTPIHLVSYKVGLDHAQKSASDTRRSSPHSLLQELLNRSDDYLWGIVSNGLCLRLLRDNISLTRQTYVEFDLETMMNDEIYADFVLLWLVCHQSRVEAERPEECWLEQWSHEAQAKGTRIREQLRDGVEHAITELGCGFLAHPANAELREHLHDGTRTAQDYYRQLLRLIYRLLVLFVAEDRQILLHPQASQPERDLYTTYYSTSHLRALADRRLGTRHSDLFYGLRLVIEKLAGEGCSRLGLPALNSPLFSPEIISDLAHCEITNYYLLAAIRHLAFFTSGNTRSIVDYKNLGSEELGSVYESLLELHPVLNIEGAKFELKTASGNERKTTGSYYTHTSLVNCLLDSALDPVLDEASKQATAAEAEQAVLNLKVCDPACGSGHFLVAAAHRLAKRLAAIRTGEEEPNPEARRAAFRDVVGRCIYGVDINPMAVELCKVSLWMEAIEPGKPLSFLDAHIQQGNSLLGTTPALLRWGIPDEAFEAIEGDDKKLCSEFKKKNKAHRAGQLSLIHEDLRPWNDQHALSSSMIQLDRMSDATVEDVGCKQTYYRDLLAGEPYTHSKLLADAWCAAFVWQKTAEMRPPITEEEFRIIEAHPGTLDSRRREEIERLAKQYQFFHWHLAFPDIFRVPGAGEEPENEQAGWSGGFDVVLGNPPWEHTELKEQEWFATRDRETANAAGAERKRKIGALATTRPDLYKAFLDAKRQECGWSHFIRESGRYPLCGRGRINTYAIFAETNRLLAHSKGMVGCIVPSGIATDDTTKYFFQKLVETRSLASLFDFENRDALFPEVHRSYKFCLLTLTGSSRVTTEEARFVFFAHQVEDIHNDQSSFSLNTNDIKLFNPNTFTCPIFRSKRDAELTKAIYKRLPVLVREKPSEVNPWGVTLRQGVFNMTSDSHLFSTHQQLEAQGWQLKGNIFHKDGEKYLPLYEGKMVWHFDHRFGGYENASQGESEARREQHADPYTFSLPRYWVHESQLPAYMRDGREALLVFRDITNSTNARTAIFSILPHIPCVHTLPIMKFDARHKREEAYLASCFSSFVFDYVARQKMGGTHMTFFILKQLPVLFPGQYSILCSWDKRLSVGEWILPHVLELTYTAWDLQAFARDCGYDGPPFRWDEERRFLLRCELDAAYFHLYGIERDDVDYIMETFPIVKRDDEKQHGEYRTKRVMLEIYDAMQQAKVTGVAYQTRLDPPAADPRVAHEPGREEKRVLLLH